MKALIKIVVGFVKREWFLLVMIATLTATILIYQLF
jgi:hypothetical protein